MTTPGEPASQILLPTLQTSLGAFLGYFQQTQTQRIPPHRYLFIKLMLRLSWLDGPHCKPEYKSWTGGNMKGFFLFFLTNSVLHRIRKTYLMNPALMLLHPVRQASDRNPITLQ